MENNVFSIVMISLHKISAVLNSELSYTQGLMYYKIVIII